MRERERRKPNQTAPGISIPIPPRQKQIPSRLLAPKVVQDFTGMLGKDNAGTSTSFFIFEVYTSVNPDITKPRYAICSPEDGQLSATQTI